ncbi:MAG: hypothetical protein ABI251_08055 [Mycobacteriaceae bacterium]
MRKVVVLTAAAVGYVLGSRPDFDQYHQIKDQTERVWRDPRVQNKTSQITTLVKKAAQAKNQLVDRGQQATDKGRPSRPDNPGRNGHNPLGAAR